MGVCDLINNEFCRSKIEFNDLLPILYAIGNPTRLFLLVVN
jgi:hypothetical protein